MFQISVIVGLAIFGIGLIWAPGLWKLAWIAASFVLIAFIPAILANVLDPLNIRRIRKHCADAGLTDVAVEAFPNHYGVHFRKNDRTLYAKCTVAAGRIKWKGPTPAEME